MTNPGNPRDPFPPIEPAREGLIDPREIDWSKPIPISGLLKILGSIQVLGQIAIPQPGGITIGADNMLPGASSQLHIHNILEHIALFETDDPNYPDNVFVIDINSLIARLFWYAPFPTPIDVVEMHQDGTFDIKGPTWRAGEPAYLFKERVIYDADDTFTVANYPGLRAVDVQCQGAGGGGGGAGASGAGQASAGAGGAGGSFARSFVLAADLAATEAVVVGAGGGGGATGADAGAPGGPSSFDTVSSAVLAVGGDGGAASGAAAASGAVAGGIGTTAGCLGDILFGGGDGGNGVWRNAGTQIEQFGYGGPSNLGGGGKVGASNNGSAGLDGHFRGGGGAGGFNYPSQGTAKAGGDGGDGLVVVDVYV